MEKCPIYRGMYVRPRLSFSVSLFISHILCGPLSFPSLYMCIYRYMVWTEGKSANDGVWMYVRQARRGQIEIILLCLIAIEESDPAIVRSRTPISEINLLINIPSLCE